MGPYALIRLSDTFDTVFPEIKTYGDNLRHYGPGLWFPNVAGGRPSHVYHFGPLHPINILSAIMPIWLIYSLLVLVLPPIAGYGMWRMLRGFFRLPDDISLMGGVLFLLGSLTQPFHLVLEIFNYLFPLFFMWSVVDDYPDWRARCAGVVGILTISLFSFPVLTLPEFCVTQFLMIVFLAGGQARPVKRMLMRWLCVWAAYLLLFVPVIYALFDYKDLSQRAVLAPFMQPFFRQLINIIQEGPIKSGVFCLLAGAFVFYLRSQLIRRIVLVWAIITVLAAIDSSRVANIYRHTFLAHLEFSQLQFTMAPLFVFFSMLGLNEIRKCSEINKCYASFGIIALLWLAVHYRWAPFHNLFWLNVFVTATIALFFCLKQFLPTSQKTVWLTGKGALVICFMASLFFVRVYRISGYSMEDTPYTAYFEGNSLLSNLSRQLEKNPGRVCTLGFYHSMAENYGLETADYYSSIYYGKYRNYWKKMVENQLETPQDAEFFARYYYRVGLLNGSVLREFKRKGGSFEGDLKLNISLLLSANITHIIATKPVRALEQMSKNILTNSEENGGKATGATVAMLNRMVDAIPLWAFKLALTRSEILRYKETFFSPIPIWIYELDNSFERGYLVNEAVVLESDEQVLRVMADKSIEDLRTKVFFARKDVGDLTGGDVFKGNGGKRGKGKRVELESYEPDRLIFHVVSSAPCFLVVSNCYHPKWRALIDDKPAKLLRANHCFQAIRVPTAGSHVVELKFLDKSTWVCYAAQPLAVIFFLVACSIRVGGNNRV